MSVRLRLTLTLVTLLACTAILGATALLSLSTLSNHYRAAEHHYQDLRALYEVGFRAASIRSLLNAPSTDRDAIAQHLRLAADSADSISDRPALLPVRASLHDRLNDLATHLDSSPDLSALNTDANRWLADIALLVARTQSDIVATRQAASAEFRRAAILLSIVFAATILLALAAGISLYRSVMRPLRLLDSAASRLAAADFSSSLPERGDAEFRSLIRGFNHMSSSIYTLHASMQSQVETKSRALIRSEQLAAVGTLAAGLAHEINNPLAIIAGYAQTTLRRVEPDSPAHATLTIIIEETFRCRAIVQQLLQLAHQSADTAAPEPIALLPLAHRAVALVTHLPIAKDRALNITIDPDAPNPLTSRGQPAHLLQVLINLLTNSLEASAPGAAVTIHLSADHNAARIAVQDSGCGMTPDALAHAFDPFYTDKPRRGLSGTGLGLSVSHAIIHQHHGRLLAHSLGPNLGTTFTIELPLHSPAHLHASAA
jgi:signal transduction histidine kinase